MLFWGGLRWAQSSTEVGTAIPQFTAEELEAWMWRSEVTISNQQLWLNPVIAAGYYTNTIVELSGSTIVF